MELLIGNYRILFCLIVSGYVLHVESQFDVTTDVDRCCTRAPNATYSDSTCRPTRLSASQFQQSITTPNYPKAFPPDLFCTWEVRAMPGRRILLDFRNMHLIGHVGDECVSQRLIIRSPLTGLSVGPFCGYDGLPNIVSTGNLLVVELQSPNPTNSEEYKGFQMVYTETVQATSPGLRPPEWSNGMFLEYSPSVRTKPSRYQPTPAGGANAANTPTTKKPKPKPKEPKNKTPKEKDRVMSNTNGIWNYPPAVRPYQPPRVPTRIRTETDDDSMGTEAIVGIVVGGIIVIAIISVVIAKLSYYRSDKRRKRAEQDAEEARNMQGFNHENYQIARNIPVAYDPPPAYTVPAHVRSHHDKSRVNGTIEKDSNRERHKRHRQPDKGKRQSNTRPPKEERRANKRHASSDRKSKQTERKTASESRKRTNNDQDRRPRSRDSRIRDSKDDKSHHKNPSHHKKSKSSNDRRPKRR